MALSQYISDNDAHFPTFPQGKEKMMPYLKNSQFYICPSVPRPFPPQFASQDIGQDYDFSLGWLTSLSFIPSQGSGLPMPRLVGVNEAALVDVTKIPVLSDVPYLAYADSNVRAPFPRGAACGLTWADGTIETSTTWPTFHNGGLNVLLYDGHIKWMTPDQASSMMCDAGEYAQPPFRAGGPHISRDSR
ncbi:MAG: hypothetical protein EOO38_10665 [Cytophagaceae bacterium]|nr:MAG: hypothetical protein EOO38_10665 [Cytophagaceae bacterium]